MFLIITLALKLIPRTLLCNIIQVLIEKLFYSCPDIKRVYVLIRPAKGRSSRERMVDMTARKPFNIRLKQDFILKKLVSLDSDLVEPKLGLTQADIDMLANEVDIVFHVAASVKFDAPLEVNMLNNVKATQELLDLAITFKQLKCFIHVSTAYSNCQLNDIGELIYPMPIPEANGDPMEFKVTNEMIDDRPNTYTYTKAIAENIASRYARKINIVIVRPSIVMSSLREPAEGWIDTINGPVGLSVLGALGILQKIKVNSEVVFDLIPVDIVTNALVSIGWAATEKKDEFEPSANLVIDCNLEQDNHNETSSATTNNLQATDRKENKTTCKDVSDAKVRVFNLTSGDENPCSFYHYFSAGIEEVHRKPSMRALRPLLKIPKQKGMNQTKYWIHKIFSHLLFAYIIDTLLGLCGHKKIVIKAVNRMHYANEVFDYFTSHQWNFVTDNVKKLIQLQDKMDKHIFNCDVKTINWRRYSEIGWVGCRRFILKESDNTIEYARQRYKFVCLIYYLVKLFLILAVTSLIRSLLINYSPIVLTTVLLPIYGIVYLL